MPDTKWTEQNAGWPQDAKIYLDAAEAAFDKGASDARGTGQPKYVAPQGSSPQEADALTYVYVSAWNANVMLGSAAKTQTEIDGANVRRKMFKQESGRAITKGLMDGASSLMKTYEPLEQWYSGPEISYLNMLKDMYADAYDLRSAMTPQPAEDNTSGWKALGAAALVVGVLGAAVVGVAVFSGPRARDQE